MTETSAKPMTLRAIKALVAEHQSPLKPVLEVDSRELLDEGKELHILHDGERYTLRRTSKGKLILTK